MNRKQRMDVEQLLWSTVEGQPDVAARVLKRIDEKALKAVALGGYRMFVCAINLLGPEAGREIMGQLARDEKEGQDDTGGMETGDGLVGAVGAGVGNGDELAGPDLAQFGTVVEGPAALSAIRQAGYVSLGGTVDDNS